MVNSLQAGVDRAAIYQEMQRAVPGLGEMYRLVAAHVSMHAVRGDRLLIVGAGGGREIGALGQCFRDLETTALDPSAENLQTARELADALGRTGELRFVNGTVDCLPEQPSFDIVTSLLVMQQLEDDGAKLAYLEALNKRMTAGGLLIHADVCYDGQQELRSLAPFYRSYADLIGVASSLANTELELIARMPIVSPDRTRALFAEAGFARPREVFRTLWYRCWISTCKAFSVQGSAAIKDKQNA